MGWQRQRSEMEPGRGSVASSKVCCPWLPATRSRRRARSPPSQSAASRLPSGLALLRGGLWTGWGRGGLEASRQVATALSDPPGSRDWTRLSRA